MHRPFPPRKPVGVYRREIRKGMPSVFLAVEEQLRRIHTVLGRTDIRPRSVYEVALWSQYARSSDTARGVVTLADNGHGELALGAARVSFEQTVSAYWMALDPEPRAALYEQFTAWEDHKLIEMFESLGVRPPKPSHEVRAIRAERNATAKGINGRFGWTQQPLPNRCSQVARQWTVPHALSGLNLSQKFSLFTSHWDPKIVGELNGQHVKLVKFHGPFVWHRHENEDELFLVHKGRFTMEFRDRRSGRGGRVHHRASQHRASARG